MQDLRHLPALILILVVGPSTSEAAVIIHLADMGALPPHAQPLRGPDGDGNRLVVAPWLIGLAVFRLFRFQA
jgi:hypothetical protein